MGPFAPWLGPFHSVMGPFRPVMGPFTPWWGHFTPWWGHFTPWWGHFTPWWGHFAPWWALSPRDGAILPRDGPFHSVMGPFRPVMGPFHSVMGPFHPVRLLQSWGSGWSAPILHSMMVSKIQLTAQFQVCLNRPHDNNTKSFHMLCRNSSELCCARILPQLSITISSSSRVAIFIRVPELRRVHSYSRERKGNPPCTSSSLLLAGVTIVLYVSLINTNARFMHVHCVWKKTWCRSFLR